MQSPNFFILGAAKSGTTTLANLLRQHPDVFIPRLKEPEYFSHDPYYCNGFDWYLRTFYRDAGPRAAVGDATPHYLLYEKVARRIRRDIPPAGHRFIVLLRDPVKRAYSWYWNLVGEGVEPLPFEAALDAEPERLEAPGWIEDGRSRFAYVAGGMYGRQLAAYLEHFPRSAFLVLLTDELRDPQGVCKRVCDFLSVTPDFRPRDVGRSNAASMPRSRAVQRFLRERWWFKSAGKKLLPKPLRDHLIATLNRANARPFTPPPMRPETERRLRDVFAADVRRLMDLAGQDLSAWLPPSHGPASFSQAALGEPTGVPTAPTAGRA